jgi:predicted nucleic acid-binding protein
MKKLKIYLDTSVISHLEAPDRPDRMADTHKLWELIKAGAYDVVLSSVDFFELAKCSQEKRTILAGFLTQIQYQHIEVTDDILAIADRFIELKVLTRKSYVDCQHIAAAIHTGCDLVVSWNFEHMVNIRTIKGAKVVTTMDGYKEILICSPNMLIEGGFDDDSDTVPGT